MQKLIERDLRKKAIFDTAEYVAGEPIEAAVIVAKTSRGGAVVDVSIPAHSSVDDLEVIESFLQGVIVELENTRLAMRRS